MKASKVASVFCFLVIGATAAGAEPEISVSSVRHSDPLSIRGFESDEFERLKPRAGRNLVLLQEEAKLGTSWKWGRISLVARQAATLVADEGAVRVAQDLSTPGRPTSSNSESVRIRYTGFSGLGLEIGQSWGSAPDAAGWRIEVGGQLLQLRRLRWRSVDGRVAFDAPAQRYTFDAASSSVDESETFPFQQRTGSHGIGALAQVDTSWCEPAWCLGLGVRDLGLLRWKNIPVEDLTLSSQTLTVDSDGLLAFKPLLQGRFTQRSYSQRAPAKWEVRSEAALAPEWRVSAAWQHIEDFGGLPRVGIARKRDGQTLSAHWHIHERRLGIAWSGSSWTIGFGADRLGANAHSREFVVGWRLPW